MTSFPSVQGVTVQHESALDIYRFTHTRVTQCFASETRDQQVLPPGVSAARWPFLFILTLRSDSLRFCVWLVEVVWFVCVGQMACGSDPKLNRPSFVGDIMTYLEWFLEGLAALTLFPWFVQQVEPSRNSFFPRCWMGIWRWLCEQEAVPWKDTHAFLWAPRLVPLNNDLAPAEAMTQSKSFLYAFILVLFGICLSVPLFAFVFCVFCWKSLMFLMC